jgi:hypothetical protein
MGLAVTRPMLKAMESKKGERMVDMELVDSSMHQKEEHKLIVDTQGSDGTTILGMKFIHPERRMETALYIEFP